MSTAPRRGKPSGVLAVITRVVPTGQEPLAPKRGKNVRLCVTNADEVVLVDSRVSPLLEE